MIGIIAAMEKEVKNFLSLMGEYEEKKIHHITFYEGKVDNNDIVLCVSGIGKVSSSMIVSMMIDHFKVDTVINIGVSGGFGKNVNCGDVVIGTMYSYADVDTTCFTGHEYGQIPYLPKYYFGDSALIKKIKTEAVYGTILTGDKFFTSFKECEKLVNEHFKDDNVCAFDMESTALAQACYLLDVPFLAIRAISDCIGKEADAASRYHNYVEIACKKANDVLFEILKQI